MSKTFDFSYSRRQVCFSSRRLSLFALKRGNQLRLGSLCVGAKAIDLTAAEFWEQSEKERKTKSVRARDGQNSLSRGGWFP